MPNYFPSTERNKKYKKRILMSKIQTGTDSLLLFLILQLFLIYVTISDHVISLLPLAGSD